MTSIFSSLDSQETNNKLPFSINEISFSAWLGDIELDNQIEALQLVLSTLKTLNQLTIEAKIRFIFLQKLSDLVYQLSQQLQTTYITSPFPFSKSDTLKVELSTFCNAELEKNYTLLCKSEDFNINYSFSEQQKALIISSGIQSQSRVLLYKSILYKKPEKGFWNQCYLFYLLAKQNDVLDFVIDKQNTCFNNTFKQILIFELCNTQQYSTEEIIAVFNLLSKFADQAELVSKVSEKKFRGVPFINLREDNPPSLPKGESQQENPYVLNISSLNVIKQLFELSSTKKIPVDCSKALLLRLIKSLTMNQQRLSDREFAKGEMFAIIGFDKVKAFLLDNQKSNSGKRSHKPGEIRDLNFDIKVPVKEKGYTKSEEYRSEHEANLTIAKHFEVIEHIESNDIWSKNKKQQKANPSVKNTELVDKSSSGFRLCLKDKETATIVGDIIGLIISKVLVITVVRRIIEADKHETHVGVEVLGKNAEVVGFFYSRNQPKIFSIFLHNDEEGNSIIVHSNDFQNEEYFFVDYEYEVARYRVEKQLHSSSIIRHLKVGPA